MSTARKTGLILVILGICLPVASMPFITEFHPQPDICLTSNFFGNLGNMMVVFGSRNSMSGDMLSAIPYRYLFSAGVILVCTGLGILVMTAGKSSSPRT